MGFGTALSGLQAAATNLQVTSNNIANSQTVGFKESRAEFADMYASSMNLGNVGKAQPGAGVNVAEVAQQFNQGNMTGTHNTLDFAVNGNGFFVVADQVTFPDPNNRNAPGSVATPMGFTRNGAFKLDDKGTIVNSQGQYLLTYAQGSNTTDSSSFSRGVFKPLTIDSTLSNPASTKNVDIKLNLDVSKPAPTVTPFDRTNSKSYNNTTAVSVFDSQGNSHVVSTYYVKDSAAPNSWNAYVFVDDYGITAAPGGTATVAAALAAPATGGDAGAPIPLTFTSAGLLDTVNGGAAGTTNIDIGDIDLSAIDPNLQVDSLKFDVDFAGSTQFATPFSVNAIKQDGLPVGEMRGIEVDKEGVVTAHYSNGSSKAFGQVALARFNNTQGLSKLGDTMWAASVESGEPIYGAAGTNGFGEIMGSNLESSNVDLSEQLVKLIIAQQNYQANAQSITTEKSLLETILRA